jgi:hypothetical protein
MMVPAFLHHETLKWSSGRHRDYLRFSATDFISRQISEVTPGYSQPCPMYPIGENGRAVLPDIPGLEWHVYLPDLGALHKVNMWGDRKFGALSERVDLADFTVTGSFGLLDHGRVAGEMPGADPLGGALESGSATSYRLMLWDHDGALATDTVGDEPSRKPRFVFELGETGLARERWQEGTMLFPGDAATWSKEFGPIPLGKYLGEIRRVMRVTYSSRVAKTAPATTPHPSDRGKRGWQVRSAGDGNGGVLAEAAMPIHLRRFVFTVGPSATLALEEALGE